MQILSVLTIREDIEKCSDFIWPIFNQQIFYNFFNRTGAMEVNSYDGPLEWKREILSDRHGDQSVLVQQTRYTRIIGKFVEKLFKQDLTVMRFQNWTVLVNIHIKTMSDKNKWQEDNSSYLFGFTWMMNCVSRGW